jgi:hypothetical protein
MCRLHHLSTELERGTDEPTSPPCGGRTRTPDKSGAAFTHPKNLASSPPLNAGPRVMKVTRGVFRSSGEQAKPETPFGVSPTPIGYVLCY